MAATNLINETGFDDLQRLYAAASHAGYMADRAVVEGTVGSEQDACTALRDFRTVAMNLFPFDVAELLLNCVDAATSRSNEYGF